MKKIVLYHWFALQAILLCPELLKAQTQRIEISDTIYYNGLWQLCEQQNARFYRIGTMAIDSFWYYTGPFKEFTISNKLLFQGEYSTDGYRHGKFYFYYPNGRPRVIANYRLGVPDSVWKYFYDNGLEKGEVYFSNLGKNFEITLYIDEKGDTTLKNGNGYFVWNVDESGVSVSGLHAQGNYKNGKRDGSWCYYSRSNELFLKELYNKDGSFKKKVPRAGQLYMWSEVMKNDLIPVPYYFEPPHFVQVEQIAYDSVFGIEGKENAAARIFAYLQNHVSPDISVNDTADFGDAMSYMSYVIARYNIGLDSFKLDVEGKIEFKLGDKGYPEDVHIQALHMTQKEVDHLYFLMNKFNNIKMPGTNEVGIEGYHSIYFYLLDIRHYFPASIRPYIPRTLFWAPMPKEKFLERLKNNKKEIRKYLRAKLPFL